MSTHISAWNRLPQILAIFPSHIKNLDGDHWNIPVELMENTCVCMSAGSVSHYLLLQCNVYMDPWITTKGAHSDPVTDYHPHSLSRFHILYHMRGTDKRGSVCLVLALMKTATLPTHPSPDSPLRKRSGSRECHMA